MPSSPIALFSARIRAWWRRRLTTTMHVGGAVVTTAAGSREYLVESRGRREIVRITAGDDGRAIARKLREAAARVDA
jgi:hypothetical protein